MSPEPTPKSTVQPTATTPPPMSSEEILKKVEDQLNTLDLPNTDSEAAKAWLKEFRVPLASMTVNAIVGLVAAHEKGISDVQLEAMYRRLNPSELNSVLKANAATLEKITSERAREVALWRLTKAKVTTAATSFIMSALLSVLGVPAIAAMTAPKP